MPIHDINQIEQRLSDLLEKKRKEAISYSIVTIIAMPCILVVLSFITLLIFIVIVHDMSMEREATLIDIYTFLNCYLALMILIILRHTFMPDAKSQFDKTSVVSIVIYFFLLFLTYGIKLPLTAPVFFGIIYAILGFSILGLLGRIYFDLPLYAYEQYDEDSSMRDVFNSFVLLISGFIFRAYGEIFSNSWLWSPPNKETIRVCAMYIQKISQEKTFFARDSEVERPILNILFRLKFIERKENLIQLTSLGLDLVKTK
ncbi:MAG: hypothetical protein JXA96_06785 [Sedimentisphaerales bacterium]|nr:hypothetical protein [Sedimentisphaerales bacterium]